MPLPSVWARAMKCKQNLTTNEIIKYKAQINVHGGKQEFGVNFMKPILMLSHGLPSDP